MLVLAIFPCLYFLPLSFSFSENLVKKLKLQIIDTCMYADIQKYQITAAYRPVMAYRVCFFAACFISLHNLLPLTLPLHIQKSTVSKVSAEQNIKEHKVTKFRTHFTCRDKVQNDIFSEGCLNNQKLTHGVPTWHKNQWYQLIWQRMDRSRCEQRLSVKALQNIPSLRDIFTAGYKRYVITKRSKEAVDSGVLRCGTANQIGWSLHLLFLPLWKILVNEKDFQMPCGKMFT